MNSELMTQGLLIAAIGMGLVFVVIIFLWGLMALLMRLTSGGNKPTADSLPTARAPGPALAPEIETTESQRRAAAAAVAVSLASAYSGEAAYKTRVQAGGMDDISPWQAYHRSRQRTKQDR